MKNGFVLSAITLKTIQTKEIKDKRCVSSISKIIITRTVLSNSNGIYISLHYTWELAKDWFSAWKIYQPKHNDQWSNQ